MVSGVCRIQDSQSDQQTNSRFGFFHQGGAEPVKVKSEYKENQVLHGKCKFEKNLRQIGVKKVKQ